MLPIPSQELPVRQRSIFEHLCNRIAVVHVSACVNGRMHCRCKDNPDVAEVLTRLASCGYDGPFILELEDLTFQPDLSLRKKTEIIAEDAAWIRTFFE